MIGACVRGVILALLSGAALAWAFDLDPGQAFATAFTLGVVLTGIALADR